LFSENKLLQLCSVEWQMSIRCTE